MRYYPYKILLTILLVLLPTCALLSCIVLPITPQPPTIIAPQIPLWSAPLSEGQKFVGLCPPIIYEHGIICLGWQLNKSNLQMFDKTSGKMIWEWNGAGETFTVKRVYTFKNVLVINNAPYIYGIDMSTGKTLWQQRNDHPASPEVRGLGGIYFIGDENSLIIGNVFTGEHTSIPFGDKPSLFRSPIWYKSMETQDTQIGRAHV